MPINIPRDAPGPGEGGGNWNIDDLIPNPPNDTLPPVQGPNTFPSRSANQFYKVNPTEYRPASWGQSGVMGGRTTYTNGPQRFAGMAGSTTNGYVDPSRHSSTSDPETIREIISANRGAGPAYTFDQETMRENYNPKAVSSTVIPGPGTAAAPAFSTPVTGPAFAPGSSKPTLPLIQTPIKPARSTKRGD